MSAFAFLVLCVQACLIQNVYSQCTAFAPGPAFAPAAYDIAGFGAPGPYALGAGLAAPAAIAAYPAGAYGGAGIGDVAVAGEMPVAGTTVVAGQVPILGAVRFAGDLPAAGTVSIAGRCGCGCNGGYVY